MVLEKLAGNDRRSIGRSNEVVSTVLKNPTLFKEVFHGMLAEDPVVRMRAADAVEKITAEHPEFLESCKRVLIRRVANIDQQEVQWHVAQMIPRLDLSESEFDEAVQILSGYLRSKSSIVKTFALQALSELAGKRPSLRPRVLELLKESVRTGTPAMQSRARKLVRALAEK